MNPIYEDNKAERIAAGLHPKMGYQSLSESRRILMTWTKADLVEFVLREESDAIKASERASRAEQALRDHRAEAWTMPKATAKRPIKNPLMKAAWERWLHVHKGQTMDAEWVFNAGFAAASEGDES